MTKKQVMLVGVMITVVMILKTVILLLMMVMIMTSLIILNITAGALISYKGLCASEKLLHLVLNQTIR